MNLLEIIADVLQHPEDAWDRLMTMGVQQEVADHIMPLIEKGGEIQVEEDGRWTTIAFRNDLP